MLSIAAEDRIGSELDARLQEEDLVLGLPLDQLEHGSEPDHVALEVDEAARMHLPIARPGAEANRLGHAIGDESLELEAPAVAVLGDPTGEIAGHNRCAASACPLRTARHRAARRHRH